jgi:hypothetical protein
MDNEQRTPDNKSLSAAQEGAKPAPSLEIVPAEEKQADAQAIERAAESLSALSLLNAEELAINSNVDEANRILAEGRLGLSDAARGSLVAGRAFNKLKPMFPKGKWLPRLQVESARVGRSIRSIQECMLAAKKADAENANVRVFAQATDPQATAIKEAVAKAEKQVEAAITANDLTPDIVPPKPNKPRRKSPPRLDGVYRLPLPMTGDEKDAMDELRTSEKWEFAEIAIMTFLRHLLIDYGFTKTIDTVPGTEAVPTGYVATDEDLPTTVFPAEMQGRDANTPA